METLIINSRSLIEATQWTCIMVQNDHNKVSAPENRAAASLSKQKKPGGQSSMQETVNFLHVTQ